MTISKQAGFIANSGVVAIDTPEHRFLVRKQLLYNYLPGWHTFEIVEPGKIVRDMLLTCPTISSFGTATDRFNWQHVFSDNHLRPPLSHLGPHMSSFP